MLMTRSCSQRAGRGIFVRHLAYSFASPGIVFGISSGWSCLEVGAGAGSIARWLAHQVGPTGRVVATDIDTRFFADAAGINLEVWRHDISCDPLPYQNFDLVHVRWLLDLLTDRDALIKKLITALKPRGWLLVEEPDKFPSAAGASGAYRKLKQATAALLQSAGTDHEWARTLPAVLNAAGLVNVTAEANADIFQGGSPMAELRQLSLAQLREPLLQAGLITEAELDSGATCLAQPSQWLMDLALVAAWGQKPCLPA